MDIPFEHEEPTQRYVIGIDLGTTNSAVAYVDLSKKSRDVQFFEVMQLVAPGEAAPRSILPSFLYLPGEYELPPGATALEWDPRRSFAVGEFAREQGARVPGRLVASAKSWLAHAGVDRTASILPWGADDSTTKVSPIEASRRYLQHMREAWDATVANKRDGYFFHEQIVILTVPASFDEVARELTVQAAHDAGIPRPILIEEPLAAFYAWLSAHEESWQDEMRHGQVILVCDVGGGTTDFSLIGIQEGEKGLRFTRLAVGDHLMLGGDNMDHALARRLETKMLGQSGKLDPLRWHQLVHQCRRAKEDLLSNPDLGSVNVTLPGTSGRLIADTLTATLMYDEVRDILVDGFFPVVSKEEKPAARRGLMELGLPYVQDAAVTRHLAFFWQQFEAYLRNETGRDAIFPDFLLFNGGALAPAIIRERIKEIVGLWFEEVAGSGWAPVELSNPRPELAVAVGASYYGRVRLGEGVRISSGSPRAYYVGVGNSDEQGTDQARGASSNERGIEHGRVAVCVVPRGTEEGFHARLDNTDFVALANQPVSFHVFSSSTRLGDEMGQVVALGPEDASVLPPVRTVLRFGKKQEAKRLPVRLAVRLTELGTLELWCESEQTDHRWQLRFDARQESEPTRAVDLSETIEQATVDAAQAAIREAFATGADPRSLDRIRKRLEEIVETPRDLWPLSLLRSFADTLLGLTPSRKLSTPHEARWFNLTGFCLRPGFGYPVDEWRVQQAWKLYLQGLEHRRQEQCRSEWWIFWRRVAGGLTAGQQRQIYEEIGPVLDPLRKAKPSRLFPERMGHREELEVWMTLANLERLANETKTALGRLLLKKLEREKPDRQLVWSLGRLGSRQPIYGPIDRVASASEVEDWISRLQRLDLEATPSIAQSLVTLARATGDRARDVSEAARESIGSWVARVEDSDRLLELLRDPHASLDTAEQDWLFGEHLPSGLMLHSHGESEIVP